MIIIDWIKGVFGPIIEVTGLPIFIVMMLFLIAALVGSFLKVGN